MSTGDVVVLHEDGVVPTKWPIVQTFTEKDGLVRLLTSRLKEVFSNAQFTSLLYSCLLKTKCSII